MRVEARSFGPIARLALQQNTMATVVASFDRSFYLQTDHGVICVASDCLYDGPINILIRASDRWPTWFHLGIAVGQRWTMRGELLSRINGPKMDIDFGAALAWWPKPPTWHLQRRKAAHALDGLRKLAGFRCRSDGLLGLVLDRSIEPTSATGRAAMAPLGLVRKHAVTWLRDGDLRITAGLGNLLGFGPGLTPSGDDLIAGLLIACHYTGHGKAALALWRRLENAAKKRTTPISFAHLSAAGQGLGAAPFHDLLDALMENRTDRISKTLDAVAGIGHCSGLDAVGGLVLLFDAWVGGSDNRHVAA